MMQLIRHAAHFAKKRLRTETIPMQRLCSILSDLDKALEQGPESNLRTLRAGNVTQSQRHQTQAPESGTLDQSLPSSCSDVSMYTLPNTTGLSDEELLGRFPELDGYNNDTLHYYGMDIGTWIGLESIRWDVI